MLMVDKDSCRLYELFAARKVGATWHAGSGATWDLRSNALRPAGWTSADAAGLPIFPGLVRYDEVAAGVIQHALRFTVQRTHNSYVWPARHRASRQTDASLPPMGTRFRLRADFDMSRFAPENQVILRALQSYGMILADNGSNWFLSGAPDRRWNDDRLRELLRVRGSDFEAVDVSSLMVDANSAQARGAAAPAQPPARAQPPAQQPAAQQPAPAQPPVASARPSQTNLRIIYAGAADPNPPTFVGVYDSMENCRQVAERRLAALQGAMRGAECESTDGRQMQVGSVVRGSLQWRNAGP